jgi:hypothetical protein
MGHFLINIRRYLDKGICGLIRFERPAAAMGSATLAGFGNKENLDAC